MTITQPCIISNMNEQIYHADPCVTPSGSRSFLNEMIRKTPRHAMLNHPRLNPGYVATNHRKFDLGGAAHDYVLRGGDNISILEFDDYRKKDAQAERDAVLSLGKLPILAHQHEKIKEMESALRSKINRMGEHSGALQNGKPESAIFWHEDGLWFRTMPDWITDDGWLDDYKTTGAESPRAWMDGMFVDHGDALQAYMALRGYHAVTGNNAKGVRFWVQEDEQPFESYCVIVDPTMLECAEADFEHGKHLFDRCMETGNWPGYHDKPYVVYPGFKANRNFEIVKIARNTLDAERKSA